MLAEIKDSPTLAAVAFPGTIPVPVGVAVWAGDPPTSQPSFAYNGLPDGKNFWNDYTRADFTLTLDPQDFPEDFALTFTPLASADGPITWRNPGPKDPVDQPSYIDNLALSDDSQVLTFTVWNTAVPGRHVIICFTLNVLITDPDGQVSPYSSPDPTIINVDPTGPPPVGP